MRTKICSVFLSAFLFIFGFAPAAANGFPDSEGQLSAVGAGTVTDAGEDPGCEKTEEPQVRPMSGSEEETGAKQEQADSFEKDKERIYSLLNDFFSDMNGKGDAGKIITLIDSLRLGQRHSVGLADARSKSSQAYYVVEEVKSAKRPTLTLNGTGSWSGPVQTVSLGDLEMQMGNDWNWNSGVATRYLISNFGLFEDSKKAAWLRYLGARVNEETVELSLYNNVMSSYFNVLEMKGLLLVANQAVSVRQLQLELSQARFEEGVSPRYDVLNSDVYVKQAQQQQTNARRALELQKASLRNILGMSQLENFDVLRPPYMEILDRDLENALELAFNNRPEIAQLNLAVETAKTNVDIAYKGKAPSLVFTGAYDIQSEGFGRTPNAWSTAISIQIPIFDGGAAKSKVAQAKEVLVQTELSLEQAKRDVAFQVNDAYLRIEESKKKLQTAESGLLLAKEAYEISLERYRESIGTYLELDDATVNYMSAMASLASAYCEFERSQVNYFYATGLLVKEVQNNYDISQNMQE